MKKLRLLTVVGARPQFIKAAPLSRLIQEESWIEEVMVHTGQHYDPLLSDVFFRELQIPTPQFQLEVGSLSHAKQTAKIMEKLEPILMEMKPDWVLVYGDTNSTLAGALTAAKMGIPVAHVEAGLRSFDMQMPEEINRRMVDHLSTLLFTPTEQARLQLLKEGFNSNQIWPVGDIMWDALSFFSLQADKQMNLLNELSLTSKNFILSTVHRQSNTDNPKSLEIILDALNAIASEIQVVLPLHPRTRSKLPQSFKASKNLNVISPLGYLDMLKLQKEAACIVTDSGGIQKEAFFFKVPCVTLRENTEWTELLELGWNRLSPPSSVESIVQSVRLAIQSKGEEAFPYGDGRTAQSILKCLYNLT